MKQELMTASFDQNNIQINIPLDLLTFAQHERPEEPYEITDKYKMASYIVKNIIEFQHEVGQQETGNSDFTDLLDRLFTDAYESGEDWIEPIDWE